jgi:hypothetical protein
MQDKNHDIKKVNIIFENLAHFNYLGMTVTNKNLIQEERLNSGNSWYHRVQNLSCYRLLFKIVNVGVYEATILLVVLCGCETRSLILRE